ncbi:MAG: lytic transglycosylase domain-containing protein [Nannocystaceae bacterium]
MRSDDFTAPQRQRIAAVQSEVSTASAQYGLDPALINGVIWVESRFQPRAKSPAGARGLMQLMPATARELARQLGDRRARPYDPGFNIRAGSFYLSKLLRRYDGDERLALAAYNAGPGNVSRWLAKGKGLPEYSQRYVASVVSAQARFRSHDDVSSEPQAHAATPPPRTLPTPAAAPIPAHSTPGPDASPSPRSTPRRRTTTPQQRSVAQAAPRLAPPVFEPRPELDNTPPQRRAPGGKPAAVRPSKSSEIDVGVLPDVRENRRR